MGPSGKGIEEHCQRSKGRGMAATKKRAKKITPTCRCNVLPPPAHDFYNIIVDVIDYGEGVGERL